MKNRSVLTVIVLLAAYVLSYATWSRIAFEESRQFGDTKSFHYFPLEKKFPVMLEVAIRVVYSPLNWIDQTLFGAPWPGGFLDIDFSMEGEPSNISEAYSTQ